MNKPTLLEAEQTEVTTVSYWSGGKPLLGNSKRQLPVTSPISGKVIAQLPVTTPEEFDNVVETARLAQPLWEAVPIKERAQVMYRLKTILERESERIAHTIHQENGKTIAEAKAGLHKGIECVEYSASLPQIVSGEILQVSRGVECRMARMPMGVVAGITPFNFPAMIPLWMAPLAITLGNAFILKPSEQTPITSIVLADCFREAGVPDGIFSVVHGDREIVEKICEDARIKAVGFVGSTAVARKVYCKAGSNGKRARCMGGAKNHLTVMPDADPEMSSSDIVASVTGCAGQRCMAASVLLAVGNVDTTIDLILKKMQNIVPGRDMGPVINKASKARICNYLEGAEQQGARLLLDGRIAKIMGSDGGYYIGPSIIDNATASHEAAYEEIFGPVLTIIRVKSLDEAIAIENGNPYGNAASIYTSSGAIANYYAERVSAGMVGINIGVPVPREPFSFGGWNNSRFGDGDITGAGAIDFWSQPKKITTKWEARFTGNWMS